MQKKTVNDFVYMAKKSDQSGITYLSILFSLMILLLILPFFGFIYQSAQVNTHAEELAIDQGFRFIQEETEQAVKFTVSSDSVTFLYEDGTISTINLYQNLIRRQVAGQGHEILLRDIRNISFSAAPYGLHVILTTGSGNKYEKKIYIFSG